MRYQKYLLSESMYGLNWHYFKKYGKERDVWMKEFIVKMTLPKYQKMIEKLTGYTTGYGLDKADIEVSLGNEGYTILLPDEVYMDLHKRNILNKIDDIE